MANFEIDEEVLVAFLKGELDAAQAAAVEAWYDRSAANRRMLGQVYYILYVSDRINDAAGIDVERSLRQFKRRMHAGRRISLRRITLRAAAAAAVAVILLAGGVTTVSLSKRLAQPLTVITHLGERSQVVLNTYEAMPGTFTTHPDMQFPAADIIAGVKVALGGRDPILLDAT